MPDCIPFGFEGRMWDLLVSVPDHCLSFYFVFSLFFIEIPVSKQYRPRSGTAFCGV